MGSWRLSLVSDRWGNVIPDLAHRFSEEAIWTMRGQMWDEMTFIAEKDDVLGILFEIDFCSKESEALFFKKNRSSDMRDWYKNLPVRDVVIERVLVQLDRLAELYPGVNFCVPVPETDTSRPLAWAFVPNGVLGDSDLETLGGQMVHLLR